MDSSPDHNYGGSYLTGTPSMWQCGTCQLWVSFGAYHQCPTIASTTDQRIAAALERIAHTLELMQKP